MTRTYSQSKLCSDKLEGLLYMIFLSILENKIKQRQLSKSFSYPALKIRVPLAVFKSSGKIPSSKDNLKICLHLVFPIASLITSQASFYIISLGWKSSFFFARSTQKVSYNFYIQVHFCYFCFLRILRIIFDYVLRFFLFFYLSNILIFYFGKY